MEGAGSKSKGSSTTESTESGGEEPSSSANTGVVSATEDTTTGVVSPASPSSVTTSFTTAQGSKRNAGPCYVKCLINDAIAGSLIGRKGSVINSIKQDTGCFMRLSAPRSFFPNSQWRIVVASGSQSEIDKAIATIVEKTHDRVAALQFHDSSSSRLALASPNLQCRIVAPKSSISALIGTGGHSVRELQQRTQTRVQISAREHGSHERVITVSGHQKDLIKAVTEIVTSMQSDSNLKDIMSVVYKPNPPTLPLFTDPFGPPPYVDHSAGSYPPSPYNGRMFPPPLAFYPNEYLTNLDGQFGNPIMNGYCSDFAFPPCNVNPATLCEIRIKVPDVCVRLVIGRRRVGLLEIQNATGTRVHVLRSPVENAGEHDCSISGRLCSVHLAHKMMLQRIEYFNNHNR